MMGINEIINSVLALLALLTLIWAVYSGSRSVHAAEMALKVADKTFKDSSLPILARKVEIDRSSHNFYSMALVNTGQGPLYDFAVKPAIPGISHSTELSPQSHDLVYYVQVEPQGAHPKDSAHFKITYNYKDRFGRRFKAEHNVGIANLTIDPSYEVGPPTEVTE